MARNLERAKRKTYPRDWSAYNSAQVNEGATWRNCFAPSATWDRTATSQARSGPEPGSTSRTQRLLPSAEGSLTEVAETGAVGPGR